jgi:preprotein translocase subunit YajC
VLDFLIPAAFAQQQGAPGAPSLFANLLPILVLVPLFYFLLIRPQMKRSREMREMLSKLAKGDEVVTSGGLAGRLTAIGDSYVTLEIAEGVEVKAQKSAITGVLPKGTLKNL